MNDQLEPTDECPVVSVAVPLYNEEENVRELHRRLDLTLSSLNLPYEIIFVNDGSRDGTARLIEELHRLDRHVIPLHLSRNFGHQAAISAGIDHARGQAIIIMDGDMQDPPEVLPRFLEKWHEGYEVIYAVRQRRKENRVKRLGYHCFYRILQRSATWTSRWTAATSASWIGGWPTC